MFEEDVKLWSNDVTSFLFFVELDKEEVTPDDETRLGDVSNDTTDPKADDEENDVEGFSNEVGISITEVELSLEVDGMILILLTPPVSSIVI